MGERGYNVALSSLCWPSTLLLAVKCSARSSLFFERTRRLLVFTLVLLLARLQLPNYLFSLACFNVGSQLVYNMDGRHQTKAA